jgi:hypothetical protein
VSWPREGRRRDAGPAPRAARRGAAPHRCTRPSRSRTTSSAAPDATEPEGERAAVPGGRGIRAAIERFGSATRRTGWRALREEAHRHGIDDEVLLAAGLIKESERGEEPYDRFRDRLIFPIAELGGRVIAFGGRVLSRAENAPKYLNSPETPIYHKGDMLYGLNWSKGAIRREGAALVVEGYMDYVSLAGAASRTWWRAWARR